MTPQFYLIVWLAIIIVCIGSVLIGENTYNKFLEDICGVSFITTLIGSFVFPLIVTAANVGLGYSETQPAEYGRVDNVIFAVAKDFPPQYTTDMKFVDKQLKVEKTTYKNGWGWVNSTNYEIKER